MTTKLPIVLDSLRVATPCHAAWDDMRGDERVRFCGRCEKNVYNLSAMPRAEAEALVREKEGRLCVRFFRRQDGTLLTSDCPVGVRRQKLRERLWSHLSGAAAGAALFFGILGARARADLSLHDGKQPAPQALPIMQGEMVASPEMGKPTAPTTVVRTPAPPPRPHHTEVKGGPVFMGDVAFKPEK